VAKRVQKKGAATLSPLLRTMSGPCCNTDCVDSEYDFVCSVPDGLICKVCLTAAHDPQLTGCCGNNICRTCFDKWKNANPSTSVSCPVCGTPGVTTFTNKLSDREIRKLIVHCTNKSGGCEWTGEVNDIETHVKRCEFESVPCPNGCDLRLQRQFLDLHTEFECPNCEAYCQLCYVVDKKHFIEGKHMNECPKLGLPCPNDCRDELILREEMASHRAICPLERVRCEYYQMGCDVAVLRKDMADHMIKLMPKHLDLSKQYINKIASKYTVVKSYLKQTSDRLVEKERLLKDTLAVVEHNQWPMIISSEASRSSYGVHALPLMVRVTQVSKKERKHQEWHSNGFLTDVGGYKLRLLVDVGGPHGTHMAVYTQLMHGPNDNTLVWPLKGKFIIKLLNQISDSDHHTKMWLYNNSTPRHATNRVNHGSRAKHWGARSFISLGRLHSVTSTCQYINDDCIYFKVMFQQL